jgi:tetratricopeptide (TPR) repeat protein
VDRLLLRGQRNLLLHGLSFSSEHLRRAVEDFRTAYAGLPPDAGDDRRFDVAFSLAFALVQADLPPDPKDAAAQVEEVQRALQAAAAVRDSFPGLWIVSGMIREHLGDLPGAADEITRGLDGLEGFRGLQPWQEYQLRLFGHLARGRAFLAPSANRELLAEKDFLRAKALAEEARRDPLTPANSRLLRVVLTHLAAAKQKLDYYDEAVKILEYLLQDDPGNPAHSLNMGFVQARLTRFPEAVDWYRKAAALDGSNPVPHLKIAYILLNHPERGKEPDLKAAAREGEIYRERTGAEDAEYCCIRGEVLFLGGRESDAMEWYRRALGHAPRCQRALLRLIQHLGRKADATEAEVRELEDLKKRLLDATQDRNSGGGMETEKSDFTFC